MDICTAENKIPVIIENHSICFTGAKGERCRWQMKRVGGSVNKGVCQAIEQADDHCEQRKGEDEEAASRGYSHKLGRYGG